MSLPHTVHLNVLNGGSHQYRAPPPQISTTGLDGRLLPYSSVLSQILKHRFFLATRGGKQYRSLAFLREQTPVPLTVSEAPVWTVWPSIFQI